MSAVGVAGAKSRGARALLLLVALFGDLLLPSRGGAISPVSVTGMSVADEAGQVIVAEVSFGDLGAGLHYVRDTEVGGIVYLDSPGPSLASDNAALHLAGGIAPPWIMTDEEGGQVQRLAPLIGSYPSARQLGAAPGTIRTTAASMGAAMRGLGFDLDLAPVADTTWSMTGVIGDRSFSGDTAAVGVDSALFAQGLIDAAMVPVVKHFPGHGQADADSHLQIATTPPIDSVRSHDLPPFAAAVQRGAPIIMVGHLVVPGLTEIDATGSPTPATISPAAINGLLRDELGYDGVVVTDSLSMQGVLDVTGTVEEAAVRALVAGADMTMLGRYTNPDSVRDAIVAAVASGRLPRARLDEAVARVLRAKKRQLPMGSIDQVDVTPANNAHVRGWALDPDTVDPIAVHVYVGGVLISVLPANNPRTDVAAAFPAYGAAHGFEGNVDLSRAPPGPQPLCVYGINNRGANPKIGCRTVQVGDPYGSLDSASPQPGGTVNIAGWAIDPDTAAPITVHVYVDGVPHAITTANTPRPDLATTLPAYGPDHGYTLTLTGIIGGLHNICTYGINTGYGNNHLLACQLIKQG